MNEWPHGIFACNNHNLQRQSLEALQGIDLIVLIPWSRKLSQMARLVRKLPEGLTS
jgi:hypothetical protein